MQRKILGDVSDPVVTLVPITSDKGLCGAINTSIVRDLKKMVKEGEVNRSKT
jgi:F0F1-type ATP synthase gamma subunit